MIGEGKKKLCVSKDVSASKEEGAFFCSTCGSHSDDKSVLCDPEQ